jgi:sec-independent protein translocase protein TatC
VKAVRSESSVDAAVPDLRFAITIGIVLSSAVWLYQIRAFLVPALSRRERRYGFGFFFSAVPLFLAGCCAGWLVMSQIESPRHG